MTKKCNLCQKNNDLTEKIQNFVDESKASAYNKKG
jgi:hypothetical protein